MKHSLLSILSFASFGLSNVVVKRGCGGNNCNRGVTGTGGHIPQPITSRQSDCSSFMTTTITPDPVTTTISVALHLSPQKAHRDVNVVAPRRKPVGYVDVTMVDEALGRSVPTYVKYNCDLFEYSSACNCWGIPTGTSVLDPATVTSTVFVNGGSAASSASSSSTSLDVYSNKPISDNSDIETTTTGGMPSTKTVVTDGDTALTSGTTTGASTTSEESSTETHADETTDFTAMTPTNSHSVTIDDTTTENTTTDSTTTQSMTSDANTKDIIISTTTGGTIVDSTTPQSTLSESSTMDNTNASEDSTTDFTSPQSTASDSTTLKDTTADTSSTNATSANESTSREETTTYTTTKTTTLVETVTRDTSSTSSSSKDSTTLVASSSTKSTSTQISLDPTTTKISSKSSVTTATSTSSSASSSSSSLKTETNPSSSVSATATTTAITTATTTATTSTSSTLSSASPTATGTCTPGVCGSYTRTKCNLGMFGDCLCGTSTEGTSICFPDTYCTTPVCANSDECGEGNACLAASCCNLAEPTKGTCVVVAQGLCGNAVSPSSIFKRAPRLRGGRRGSLRASGW